MAGHELIYAGAGIMLLLLLVILFFIFRKKKKTNAEKEVKVIKSNLSILPIRHYDQELDCFMLEDGSCMDILQIIPRDVNNLSNDELQREVYSLIRSYKTIGSDIKIVSMNFPLNTEKQRDILKQHYDKAEDEVRRKWISRQIEELKTVDANIHTSNFYLFYFGNNKDDFLRNRENIDKYMCSGFDKIAEHVSMHQRVQILIKICNMNNTYDIHYFDDEVDPYE